MDGWIDGQTYMKKTIIQNNSSSNNSNSSITVSILTTHCVVRHILYYITNASVVSATASPPIHSLSLSLLFSLFKWFRTEQKKAYNNNKNNKQRCSAYSVSYILQDKFRLQYIRERARKRGWMNEWVIRVNINEWIKVGESSLGPKTIALLDWIKERRTWLWWTWTNRSQIKGEMVKHGTDGTWREWIGCVTYI